MFVDHAIALARAGTDGARTLSAIPIRVRLLACTCRESVHRRGRGREEAGGKEQRDRHGSRAVSNVVEFGKTSAKGRCSSRLIIGCLPRARSANRRLIRENDIHVRSFVRRRYSRRYSRGRVCIRTKSWEKADSNGFAIILSRRFLFLRFFLSESRRGESVLISVILVSRVVVNDPVVAWW